MAHAHGYSPQKPHAAHVLECALVVPMRCGAATVCTCGVQSKAGCCTAGGAASPGSNTDSASAASGAPNTAPLPNPWAAGAAPAGNGQGNAAPSLGGMPGLHPAHSAGYVI